MGLVDEGGQLKPGLHISLVLLTGLVSLTALHWWPLPVALAQQDYARVLLASDGELLGARIAADGQWRFAPDQKLPDKYRQALIAFEDKRFYYHPGIDPLALGRASFGNLRAGRVTSGGSTLSMQLARLLRQDDWRLAGRTDIPPRSLGSKSLEALRALQLEWHFSKEELLSLYASHAPFGGNIVGLEAAAWRYFGRSPEQLSWAEAALLAVLPNSPALIHPGRQRDKLKAKRDRLLHQLHQQELLSQLDLQLALLEPLPERPRPLPQLAPQLLDSLIAEFPDQPVFRATIDSQLQRAALELARAQAPHLANEGVHNLSLVLIDHRRMALVAYVGNLAWQEDSRYSPGVDIARRPRSTGSLLKPFLYGLMLDEGSLLPTQLVPDIPTQFGGYAPKNFDREYRGAVPAHRALAQSLNVPAVRLLKDYGIGRFQHQLQAMGLSHLFRPADDYGLTLILGGAEASLWELTGLYARLAASARGDALGSERLPGVQRFEEEPLARYPAVISQGAAWLSLQAMIEAARPGNDSLWRDFAGSQRIAWKTGTSYGLRDAWAIGSNGRYTLGVWAGNAGGEAAPGLTGQSSAAPLMFALFDRLGSASWFPRPDEALKWVRVCVDDGYLASDLCPSVAIQIPRQAETRQTSPHYRRLHLDASGSFRVHGDCESPGQMQARDWFVLPPAQAHFWKNHRSDYRPLPPWRPDCLTRARELDGEAPMELLYPPAGGRLYLPVDLDGKRSRLLLQAVHHQSGARLFWHLNDKFLGETRQFHQQAVALDPGWQRLKLVDEQGYEVEVWFEVLGGEQR